MHSGSKQYLVQKLESFPMSCTKKKIRQSLEGRIASKSIHPKCCVRLSTQNGSRGINLLYLVGKGNFKPLLGCDTCLHIEVLEFTNLELIDTPQSKLRTICARNARPGVFQTDFVLRDYEDCFSNKYIWKLIP